jgi:glycerol-3-phosphate acyltransferase PlsX
MGYRIGIDISGGDNAPGAVFEGAMLASREIHDKFVLIGVQQEIVEEARKHRVDLSNFEIVHAPDKIGMEESPAVTVRKKKDSSIAIGAAMLRDKKIDAFVSCGNTGAMVCASTLIVGLIEGVERPGIAITIPTKKGVSLIIDVGANIDCKPLHLLQYGAMASVYSRLVLGKGNPTVGILNIGEEESKGTDLYKTTHKIFSVAPLNFMGNIEAKNVFSGECDCVVCDGVMGNIALKVSESCADFIVKSFSAAARKNLLGILGYLMMRGNLSEFKKKLDYAETGGAPLLGIDGIVIEGHGRSNAKAVKNAIKVAAKELKQDLNAEIKRKIDEVCQDNRVRQILAA